jgi:hypothetical protein
MPIHEFLIAVIDEAEGNRKKEGDIIAVRPHPWHWGRKEIDGWLIVIVESIKTLEEMRTLGAQPIYRDTKDGKLMSAQEVLTIARPNGSRPVEEFEVITKNRYQVSFADVVANCPSLDLAKVRDERKIYQPFKRASQLIEKLDGLEGRRLVRIEEVEASTGAIGAEDEVCIDLHALPIFDKFTGATI